MDRSIFLILFGPVILNDFKTHKFVRIWYYFSVYTQFLQKLVNEFWYCLKWCFIKFYAQETHYNLIAKRNCSAFNCRGFFEPKLTELNINHFHLYVWKPCYCYVTEDRRVE